MEMNQGIRCPHCGKEASSTAIYCWACGSALSHPVATLAPQRTKSLASEPGRAYTSLALGFIALVLLCFAPLSALLAVCAIVKGSQHLRQSDSDRGIATAGVAAGLVVLMLAITLCLRSPHLTGGLTPDDFKEYKNKPAPGFTLIDTKGTAHSLAQYHGRAVVLNFWSTW